MAISGNLQVHLLCACVLTRMSDHEHLYFYAYMSNETFQYHVCCTESALRVLKCNSCFLHANCSLSYIARIVDAATAAATAQRHTSILSIASSSCIVTMARQGVLLHLVHY
jgi:hypothetical protein